MSWILAYGGVLRALLGYARVHVLWMEEGKLVGSLIDRGERNAYLLLLVHWWITVDSIHIIRIHLLSGRILCCSWLNLRVVDILWARLSPIVISTWHSRVTHVSIIRWRHGIVTWMTTSLLWNALGRQLCASWDGGRSLGCALLCGFLSGDDIDEEIKHI